MRNVLILASLLSGLLAQAAFATDAVYRWTDKDGVVHYSAQPPSKDARPADLPQLQTYSHKNGPQNLPAATTAATPAATAATPVSMRITAPVADETFRDPQGLVPVSVAVTPFLPTDGGGLVFYLDGAAKNPKPWVSTSFTLVGVERGEHSVSVALVDKDGKEVSRAAPVTFFAKPPSIR